MSFNVIGSLRVYLDMPKGGDPRTFLAVLHQGEEQVHPFDADGVSTDEAPLEALIRSAKGARVMANETDRLWAGTFFRAPSSRLLPLPPSEEARLRLLAGRARKATPLGPDPVKPPLVSENPLWDDLDALLSDDPAQAPAAEIGGADPVPIPIEDDPSCDDLDALLSNIPPEEDEEQDEPAPPSGLEERIDRLRAQMRWMSDGILEALPEELCTEVEARAEALNKAQVAGPSEAEGVGVLSGDDAEPLPEAPAADALERDQDPPDVYPVLEKHREGALDWISASFGPQWRHDRALSAILSELRGLRQDPDRFLRPGHYELYGVRFRKDILDQNRYVCLALTEKVEGRLRLRLVRFNEAPDLQTHLEEAMRVLCAHIARFESGPVEALLPVSVSVPPELMRAGGFEHLQDLPRWYWGVDCALWVRKPRR
jgi:hypothetical protein